LTVGHHNKSRVVAGMTARCRCKFRYISKFTAASRGFHCDSNAFELNELRLKPSTLYIQLCSP